MSVRRATVADADRIAAIHIRTWQSAYRHLFPPEALDRLSVAPWRRSWRRRLEESGPTVLVGGEPVAGFASAGPSRDEEGVGELYAIYVDPDRWGTGLGRALLVAAEAELVADGFVEATLWVLDDNPRARRFYEAAGWRPDGATKVAVHLDLPATEVRYRKRLAA